MPAHIFFAAPHRVMFFSGLVQLLLAFALWSVELLLRNAGHGGSLFPGLPSVLWHPLLMVFGFFPFLIFGFLMTALPKWVGAPALAAPAYLSSFYLAAGGWLLFYLAAAAALPWLSGAALLLVAAGWVVGGQALARAAGVANPDKRHAWSAIGLVYFGAAMLAASAAGIALDRPALVRTATLFGLWGFVLPIFVVVAHRMLPFFSQGTIKAPPFRPMSLLWGLLAVFFLHAAGNALGSTIVWLADAVGAGLALTLSWRWRLFESLPDRLLATHHFAFVWLGIALAAFALQGLLAQLGIDWGRQAPLHALTTGFLLSMVFGMATRVTLGHSGQPITAASWLWPGFCVLQAAIALRLVAEFLPAGPAAMLLPASALLILAVFAVWGARHAHFFFRVRADGLSG